MNLKPILAALCCLVPFSASAEPVLNLTLGPSFWSDQSNSDEVEADGKPGIFAAIEAGYSWRQDRVSLRVGTELSCRSASTHGLNQAGRSSGEGDGPGYVCAPMLNLRPGYSITERVDLFGLFGAGYGWAEFFSEIDAGPTAQFGVGGVYRLDENWGIVAELRHFRFLTETKHQGARARYDSSTFGLGLEYRF